MSSYDLQQADDEELALRLMEGGEERNAAMLEIISRWGDILLHIFLKCPGRVTFQDAEDLSQETFAKVASRIEQFDNRRGTLQGWVLAIAKNEHEMWNRRKRRKRGVSEVLESSLGTEFDMQTEAVVSDPPENAIITEEVQREIDKIYDTLSPLQQHILREDSVSEGYVAPTSILASRYNTTGSYIKVQRHRARARIREGLEKKGLL